MEIERNVLMQRLEELFGEDLIEIVPASDGYHNQVFIITRSEDRVVARLSSRSNRTRNDIETELEWIVSLDRAGVRVAKPIRIPGQDQIIELNTIESAYWVVFFQHTEGRPVDVTHPNEWNQDFFHEWGRQIGVMHTVHASHVNRQAYLDSDRKGIVNEEEWLKDRLERLLDEMCSWERQPGTFGLVHNDLHQGNFHVKKTDWFSSILMILLFIITPKIWPYLSIMRCGQETGTSFNSEWIEFPVEFLTAFLEGYSTSRPLTFEMYDQLLVCLQMREIYLYSLFVSRWNADEMLDWQIEKLEQLKGNIEARVVPYGDELEKVQHLFQVRYCT